MNIDDELKRLDEHFSKIDKKQLESKLIECGLELEKTKNDLKFPEIGDIKSVEYYKRTKEPQSYWWLSIVLGMILGELIYIAFNIR